MTSIPKKTEEYLRHPFDPRLTFTANGRTARYMATPLDEVYQNEPGEHYVLGSLPPQECEVRDHIIIATVLHRRVSAVDLWLSKFFRTSETYQKSIDAFQKLEALASRSPEHRAAFLRISLCSNVSDSIKKELKQMVYRADQGIGMIEA